MKSPVKKVSCHAGVRSLACVRNVPSVELCAVSHLLTIFALFGGGFFPVSFPKSPWFCQLYVGFTAAPPGTEILGRALGCTRAHLAQAVARFHILAKWRGPG